MATSKGQASNISQSKPAAMLAFGSLTAAGEATSPGKLDGEQQIGGNRHIRALSGSTRNSALFIGILIAVAVIGSAVFILSSLGFRAFLAYPVLGSLGILVGRAPPGCKSWAWRGAHPSRVATLHSFGADQRARIGHG